MRASVRATTVRRRSVVRRLSVVHETRYRYGYLVEHAHHWLRLRPLQDERQRLDRFSLEIDPAPRFRTQRWDSQGVNEIRIEIDAPHREFVVTSRSSLSIKRPELPALSDLPWEHATGLLEYRAGAPWLEAAVHTCGSELAFAHPDLRKLAMESFVPGRPLREASLDWMSRVHRTIRYVPLVTDVETTAVRALQLGRGVCQDLAHVMIAGMRSLGLAARYVSGYLLTIPAPGQARLIGADASHAWVSIWCPQAGWFELDPTNSRAPGDDYVALARGRDYADLAPIRGVIRGGGSHTITVSVSVEDLAPDPVGESAASA